MKRLLLIVFVLALFISYTTIVLAQTVDPMKRLKDAYDEAEKAAKESYDKNRGDGMGKSEAERIAEEIVTDAIKANWPGNGEFCKNISKAGAGLQARFASCCKGGESADSVCMDATCHGN